MSSEARSSPLPGVVCWNGDRLLYVAVWFSLRKNCTINESHHKLFDTRSDTVIKLPSSSTEQFILVYMIGNPATTVDPTLAPKDNQASYCYKQMLKVKGQGSFCSQLTTVTGQVTVANFFLHPRSQENQLYSTLLATTKFE